MKSKVAYAASAVMVAILILTVAFFLGYSGSSGGSSVNSTASGGPETSSIQGENQTVFATYVGSLTTSSQSSTTTSTVSTASSTSIASTTQPQSSGGSFTYTSSSQVKVLSVAVTVSGGQPGNRAVGFSVQFQNIGANPIYVLSGGGSGLNVTITSGNSVVESATGIRCELVEVLGPLNTGANGTAFAPGCWSGYHFQLLQQGAVGVKMTLAWANGMNGGASGTIEIDAEFELS